MAQAHRTQAAAVQTLSKPAAWDRYFPATVFQAEDRKAQLTADLISAFRGVQGIKLLTAAIQRLTETACVLLFSCEELLADLSLSDDLNAALQCQPDEALPCLAAAAHEVLCCYPGNARSSEAGAFLKQAGKVQVRLHSMPDSLTHVRLMKASSIGKLVTLTGSIVRMSSIRPQVRSMPFICCKCGAEAERSFGNDARFQPPTACSTEGCKSRNFAPQYKAAHCVNWQQVRLQEVDESEESRIPRTIEVELSGDLVGCCSAGDELTVLGIVRVLSADSGGGGAKKGSSALFLLYVEALSVQTAKQAMRAAEASRDGSVGPSASRSFSRLEMHFIIKFTQDLEGQQMRHLVQALCPAILGQELVKLSMLLALFGGCGQPGAEPGTGKRGSIHVLVCGDPGLGKSQLLQAAAAVAPHGMYMCGGTSSSAGLTVSVVKDPVSGESVFEAGALVMSDGGVCCIDELDKLSAEHQALLGVLEEQSVSIAKAGLCATFPARTGVIAAANPHKGHWQRSRTLRENLKLPKELLTRFDLVFALLDSNDLARDAVLSKHVLAQHRGTAEKGKILPTAPLPTAFGTQRVLPLDSQASLAERLQVRSPEDPDPVPQMLLKTYIAYAREHVKPALSNDARQDWLQLLKAFFLDLRAKQGAVEGNCVTLRQLESLIRLCEARARMDLRELVTLEDAQDIVELMQACMLDETGLQIDPTNFGGRPRKGKQAEAQRFLAALNHKAKVRGSAQFQMSELCSIADTLDLNVPDTPAFVAELNEAGELLKKGDRMYELQDHG